ncbi:hypothetical protein [Haloarcula montana]|nr:hypothetical protein [Haloarcula sp. GH36]
MASETGLTEAVGLLSVILMLVAMAAYGYARHLWDRVTGWLS